MQIITVFIKKIYLLHFVCVEKYFVLLKISTVNCANFPAALLNYIYEVHTKYKTQPNNNFNKQYFVLGKQDCINKSHSITNFHHCFVLTFLQYSYMNNKIIILIIGRPRLTIIAGALYCDQFGAHFPQKLAPLLSRDGNGVASAVI